MTVLPQIQIVGILLIRNEDRFIELILSRIVEFCDQIIVADHQSNDNTAKIVQKIAKEYAHIRYVAIEHPMASHSLIQTYAGKPVWVFGVDGDELYDPNRLKILRSKLLKGEFGSHWVVFGNVLNCIELDMQSAQATGYLAPPCRSMTKLYNFQLINEWGGDCPERLHGGTIDFKPGSNALQRYDMYKEVDWEDSDLRCLHLCFLRRSSLESEQQGMISRKNISDINSEGVLQKTLSFVKRLFGKSDFKPQWKHEKYCRGKLVTKDISSFLE